MSPQVMFVITLHRVHHRAVCPLGGIRVHRCAPPRVRILLGMGLLAPSALVGLIAYNVLRPNTYLADREEQELDMALRERQLAQY